MRHIAPKAGNDNAFIDSAAFAERTVYRRIAKHSAALPMTKSVRAVLLKMMNLWFEHRKNGLFTPSHAKLCRSLRIADRTLRMALSWLRGKGFVHLVEGGRGRGRLASYVVDLTRIQEALAPHLGIKCAGEIVTPDGEIKPAKTHCIKPAKTASAIYRDNNIHSFNPSRVGMFVVPLRKTLGWDVLETVLRRVAVNRKAWFRGKESQFTGWKNAHAPLEMEMAA